MDGQSQTRAPWVTITRLTPAAPRQSSLAFWYFWHFGHFQQTTGSSPACLCHQDVSMPGSDGWCAELPVGLVNARVFAAPDSHARICARNCRRLELPSTTPIIPSTKQSLHNGERCYDLVSRARFSQVFSSHVLFVGCFETVSVLARIPLPC